MQIVYQQKYSTITLPKKVIIWSLSFKVFPAPSKMQSDSSSGELGNQQQLAATAVGPSSEAPTDTYLEASTPSSVQTTSKIWKFYKFWSITVDVILVNINFESMLELVSLCFTKQLEGNKNNWLWSPTMSFMTASISISPLKSLSLSQFWATLGSLVTPNPKKWFLDMHQSPKIFHFFVSYDLPFEFYNPLSLLYALLTPVTSTICGLFWNRVTRAMLLSRFLPHPTPIEVLRRPNKGTNPRKKKQKNTISPCWSILVVIHLPYTIYHMDVVENSGTPKTPQNDQF